jgi:hypothetical protein
VALAVDKPGTREEHKGLPPGEAPLLSMQSPLVDARVCIRELGCALLCVHMHL